MNKIRINKNSKGSVLVFSLIIMSMLLIITLGMATVAINERRSSISTVKSTTSFQNADTGSEYALDKFRKVTKMNLKLTDSAAVGGLGATCVGTEAHMSGTGYDVIFETGTGTGPMNCNDKISDIKYIKSTGINAGNIRAIEVSVPCSSPYGPDTGVVGLWHFQEKIATDNALDSNLTANNNPGTPFPAGVGVTLTTGICTARIFNGSNNYINVANNANSLNISDGTVEAWIKTAGAGASYRGIVVKQFAYGIFLQDNVLGVFDWSGGGWKSAGVALNDNNWHHVAFSFKSGVANGTTIYADGLPKSTTVMTISNQSQKISIGAGDNPATIQFFNGTIDEVKVLNTAKTDDYIKADFCNGCTRLTPMPATCGPPTCL
jgi:hypothetical protein